MRVANLSWGVCATVLIASAAHADEPFGAFDDSPRFMLYVQKSVGAGHHQSMGLSFGFAMEQPMNNAKLLDLRYAPEGGSVFFNGLQLTGKPIDGLGFGSYGGEHAALAWTAAGLAALLIGLCATDNDPCGDDDDDDNSNTDTSRTPG
jgi:hypothetical protein